MLKHMRTTVDLPDPLLKQLKAYSVQRGITIKEALQSAVRALLNPPATKKKTPNFTAGAVKGTGLVKGQSWSNLSKVIQDSYEDHWTEKLKK